MSEQLYGGSTSTQSGQAGGRSGHLYDSQGRMIRSEGSHHHASTAVQVEDYIRQQPLSAVLMALGVGYILGKIW
ncbi:MAG: hypothetical protein AB7Q01_12095 [Gammaproteobacteria bacterium]